MESEKNYIDLLYFHDGVFNANDRLILHEKCLSIR